MKPFASKILLLASVLILGTGPATQSATAAVTVRFSATIYQSLFSGDLALNQSLTGQFLYDPAAPRIESRSGLNYATYPLLDMSVSVGAATLVPGASEVEVADNISVGFWDDNQYDHSDVFSATGYSLIGPAFEGFLPRGMDLYMIDTDNAVYTSPTLPIDFPDPGQFELKQMRIILSTDAGVRRDVLAQINTIRVVPAPSALVTVLLGAIPGATLLLRRRKRAKE